MALFTFYPCRPDGSSIGFEVHDCADDDTALTRGRKVLADHTSSVEVVVWQGERRVAAVSRVIQSA